MPAAKASQRRHPLPPSDTASPTASPALPDRRPALNRRRWQGLRTILALILREMSTTYGRSPGGYIWAVAQPLGMIVVLAFAFAMMLRSPSLGTSFIVFYASGFLPFDLYRQVYGAVAATIRFSKPLLQYPIVSWVDAVLARFLLNMLTAVTVTCLLLSVLLLVTDVNVIIDLPPMVRAMILAALLGLGIGTLNCVLTGLFPVYANAWSIATRPLFLASGIIYIYEDLPAMAANILWYNPLIHITGLMRTGLYPAYAPQYISETYVLIWGLVPLVFGLILLGRYYRDILNR